MVNALYNENILVVIELNSPQKLLTNLFFLLRIHISSSEKYLGTLYYQEKRTGSARVVPEQHVVLTTCRSKFFSELLAFI